jgi:hypothetical protein
MGGIRGSIDSNRGEMMSFLDIWMIGGTLLLVILFIVRSRS